jgi:hypothetical protein
MTAKRMIFLTRSRTTRLVGSFLTSLFLFVIFSSAVIGQVLVQPAPTMFRVGERITYAISFDNYPTAGTAEIQVISRGRLGTKDAVELSGRFRTQDLFSAAILLVDETATTIVAADSGMPLFVKRTNLASGLAKERTENYTTTPSSGYDMLSMIYRIRYSDAAGAFTLVENGRSYAVTYSPMGTERVSTSAGDFDSTIITLQSDYFTEQGMRDVRVNVESAGDRVPLMFRAKMQNGELKATASSIQNISSQSDNVPVPVVSPTPLPTPVVTPIPTPEPYINNAPLSPDLAFELGEVLQYRVTSGGVTVGSLVLNARERKQINGLDTLVLSADLSETNAASGLGKNNKITAHVDPLTLLPRQVDIGFTGQLAGFSSSATFDPIKGSVTVMGSPPVEVPVGTHSVISLIYAMRSFKIMPSPDPNSPVNDTRVAVFWGGRSHVFYIRPSAVEITDAAGRTKPTVLATVTTENPQLNQLGMKVWIDITDPRRLPVRFTIGPYTFELEASSVARPN